MARHQPRERCNAGRCLATAEHLRPVDIEGGKMPRHQRARIRAPRAWVPKKRGKARMNAHTRLDAGLLVRGDDKFVLAQCLPCQRPYRSRIRPALASNCGSRGKIQQRCCQGRIASSCSQRQTVLSLIRATNPECSACRATSATLSRDNGRPKVAGSSQASALISTLISGGKARGRPGRARSSRPANRSLKKRFRHRLTTSRRVSSRAAISSLLIPWDAMKIILARCTSKYGNVYLAARRPISTAQSTGAPATCNRSLATASGGASSRPSSAP